MPAKLPPLICNRYAFYFSEGWEAYLRLQLNIITSEAAIQYLIHILDQLASIHPFILSRDLSKINHCQSHMIKIKRGTA